MLNISLKFNLNYFLVYQSLYKIIIFNSIYLVIYAYCLLLHLYKQFSFTKCLFVIINYCCIFMFFPIQIATCLMLKL